MDQDEVNKSDNKPSETESETKNKIIKKTKIPPIIIQTTIDDIGFFINLIHEVTSGDPVFTRNKESTKITILPDAEEDHMKIQQLLKAKEIPYYTFEKKEEKPVKMVLRGLAFFADENVKSLLEQGIKAEVIKMKQRSDLQNYNPLFLVTLGKSVKISDVYKVKSVCYMRVSWEKFKNKQITFATS
ncbi:uncharacterized protein LOC122502216 [Leptopilina heterotoma]|uniref:uncharacterized protein LOC122502216 n=1 Tax=Leptopilina heterotoma TaxID=63436 RepID=UPI001CAA0AF8|nr:uncharacterized protein LOC122502216 [Leptopilina heterotoma]